jgi:hypothetical protein
MYIGTVALSSLAPYPPPSENRDTLNGAPIPYLSDQLLFTMLGPPPQPPLQPGFGRARSRTTARNRRRALGLTTAFMNFLATVPDFDELEMEMALAESQAMQDDPLEPKNITLVINPEKYSDLIESNKTINSDMSTCGICLETYLETDIVSRLPDCPHVYHEECIRTWGKAKPECPACKVEIPHVRNETPERNDDTSAVAPGTIIAWNGGGWNDYYPPDVDLSVGYPHLVLGNNTPSNDESHNPEVIYRNDDMQIDTNDQIEIQDQIDSENANVINSVSQVNDDENEGERCGTCDGLINFECTCNSATSEYLCSDCLQSRGSCDCVI